HAHDDAALLLARLGAPGATLRLPGLSVGLALDLCMQAASAAPPAASNYDGATTADWGLSFPAAGFVSTTGTGTTAAAAAGATSTGTFDSPATALDRLEEMARRGLALLDLADEETDPTGLLRVAGSYGGYGSGYGDYAGGGGGAGLARATSQLSLSAACRVGSLLAAKGRAAAAAALIEQLSQRGRDDEALLLAALVGDATATLRAARLAGRWDIAALAAAGAAPAAR
ncbi:unnamed protein product, partial [Phaeothamnion confervicola]